MSGPPWTEPHTYPCEPYLGDMVSFLLWHDGGGARSAGGSPRGALLLNGFLLRQSRRMPTERNSLAMHFCFVRTMRLFVCYPYQANSLLVRREKSTVKQDGTMAAAIEGADVGLYFECVRFDLRHGDILRAESSEPSRAGRCRAGACTSRVWFCGATTRRIVYQMRSGYSAGRPALDRSYFSVVSITSVAEE